MRWRSPQGGKAQGPQVIALFATHEVKKFRQNNHETLKVDRLVAQV
jgi:hypothetical protein